MSEKSFSLEDTKIMLQKLLVNELFGTVENQTAILEENDSSAKLKKVEIIDVPDNSILIKIDYGKPYENFRSENGHRRRCDYLLIARLDNNNKRLLFIEMKSNSFIPEEITQKFLASECLLDYIVSMLKRFHDKEFNLNGYKKRFVSFQNKRIDKRPVRCQQDGNQPENYRSIKFDANKLLTLKSL
jgi:hypothetical protein